VAWKAPSSDGGSALTAYRITPYIGVSPQPTVTVAANTTSTKVTGLTRGTTYTFTVRATNAVGDSPESAPSNAVKVR
jgi:hypothetical protein